MKFVALLLAALTISIADPGPPIRFEHAGEGLNLSWPATIPVAGGVVLPIYELQESGDLRSWAPIGERLRSPESNAVDRLSVRVAPSNAPRFYRLLVVQPRKVAALAANGAQMFGYGEAFAHELQEIGEIPPEEFAGLFQSTAEYIPGISWDPTTAEFWAEFSADPAVVNQGKTNTDAGFRSFDFRLNEAELAAFKTNGSVVSERLGSASFADVFYRLWMDDLPVFVSTDAILQAWHRTYDAMLAETEETFIFTDLQQILDGMAGQVPLVAAEVGEGFLKESVLDAEYFLTVARSLLAATQVLSSLGQDERVAETLAHISSQQMIESSLFGQCRVVDYSQFTVRGHYTQTTKLRRYFQTMMWLGRMDFAVAGGPFVRCPSGIPQFASPRETAGAIVLWDLLQRSGHFEKWRTVDRTIEAFAGWSDSMNFAQLGGVLAGAGIRRLPDIPDLSAIERLQEQILRGEIGAQNIRSDFFASPFGSEQTQLPRAFLMFGQRFTPDSWVLSQTVFDSIRWDQVKVQRRVPSALDAAFAVLANDQIVPDLVARMNNTAAGQSALHAEKWRDGLPYQHNLAAVRRVIDTQSGSVWESSIYMSWLAALRELSVPTTGAGFPQAMRTHAWAMKTLNTQLASWTHLRHDNILYAKQSYTGPVICAYPSGFVEPRLEFWNRLRQTVQRAIALIGLFPADGRYEFVAREYRIDPPATRGEYFNITNSIPLATIRSNQVAHLRNFASVLEKLATISGKELRQECLLEEEELFIRNLIEEVGYSWIGCERFRKYDGWYPSLFYRSLSFDRMSLSEQHREIRFQSVHGADAADLVVADVHTDVASPEIGDPGSVLYQGVGGVNLLMIAVENGPERMVYAGPVLSHYEFEVVGPPRRLNDNEWLFLRLYGQYPPDLSADRVEGLAPPAWTKSFLVPR